MRPFIKSRSHKAGLPPGSLVHIGEKSEEAISISITDYNESSLQEKKAGKIEECFPFRDAPTVTWIDINGLKDIGLMEKLGGCYGIHPLILEDILNTDQRPKTDDMEDYFYVVLKMLDYREDRVEFTSEQVSLVWGKNYVISFQEGIEGDSFDPVRSRIRSGKGRIRKMGADYLAYALMDSIVDRYFLILERLGERIEDLEEELVKNPTPQTLHQIHRLKREMLFLRKSVWPLRETILAVEKSDSELVHDATRIFFRDVYDHTVQIIDTIETFREMLSGMLDIYLSSVSNRMNSIMKVLTIIATIFIPLTFFAGVYGMNFKNMPELGLKWTYPALWGFMVMVAAGMLIWFKRKKWL